MATSTHHGRAAARSRHHPHHPDAHTSPFVHKRRKKRTGQILGLASVLALAAVLGWFAMGGGPDSLSPPERLVAQMQAATQGAVPTSHVYGGRLEVVYGKGKLNVTAHGLPSKACVSAAWRLAREGVVIVNGTMPMRISAATLAELCAEGEEGAVLTWVPHDK